MRGPVSLLRFVDVCARGDGVALGLEQAEADPVLPASSSKVRRPAKLPCAVQRVRPA